MKTEPESASWLICVDGPTAEGTDSHQFDFEVCVTESQVKRLPEVLEWVGRRRITVAKALATVVPFPACTSTRVPGVPNNGSGTVAIPVSLRRSGDAWELNLGGRLGLAKSGVIRFRKDGKLDVEVDQ